MKLLGNLITVLLLVGCYGTSLIAQCEDWNNSSNKDEAENAHILYRQFVKGMQPSDLAKIDDETFNMTYHNWEKAYQLAPAANGESPIHYEEGRIILKALVLRGAYDATKNEFDERILQLYDEQMACYGNEGYLLGRKAYDMFYMPAYGHNISTFDAFKKAIEIGGNDTEYIILEPMTQVMVYLYKSNELDAMQVRQHYSKVEEIANYNIANNELYRAGYESAKARMQEQFAYIKNEVQGLDVNTNIRAEERTDNPCEDGRKLQEEGKYEEAIALYNKCISINEDPEVLAQAYYHIAFIQTMQLGQYQTARSNAQKAASYKKDWGAPYILIGDIYVKASRSCGDVWGHSLAILAAIEKYSYAKSIDSSISEVANKRIQNYSGAKPGKEEGFMRAVTAGQIITVPCWIGEQVTISFRD